MKKYLLSGILAVSCAALTTFTVAGASAQNDDTGTHQTLITSAISEATEPSVNADSPDSLQTSEAPSPLSSDTSRPNFLFIAIDDMKPLFGTYGYPDVITPNLDALATQSTVFENAYTQWPVCGPSRASLMTGTRPETNGIMNLKDKLRKLSPDMVTLPEYLKDNGYFTAGAGKIYDPRNMDSRAQHDAISWTIPYDPPRSTADKYQKGMKPAVQIINAPDSEFSDGVILDQGLDLLDQAAAQDKPFFVAVGFKKPHLPFACPAQYFDMYDPATLPIAEFQNMPKGGQEKYISFESGELTGTYTKANGKPYVHGKITEAEQRDLLHGYYACTSFIDTLVGQLLDGLEQTGKADNTVVVLWGDHGFHLGDHAMWGKHTVMEQAAIVPLYIKVPGTDPRRVSSMAELSDVFPTLIDLAGLDMPAQVDGISQLPVITGDSPSVRNAAVTSFDRKGARAYSMRTTGYRYTEWITPDGKLVYTELYDLDNDPLETVNMAAQSGNKELLSQMAALLRSDTRGLSRLK